MAALTFPAAPTIGEVYPADPGTSGVTQYRWDGAKWNIVPSMVSLGLANQGAFNSYTWPTSDGASDFLLTTDGAGNLVWSSGPPPTLKALDVTPSFDGISKTYTLVELGTSIFYEPAPSTNLMVFLGGTPQVPVVAYSVTGNQITFTDVPPVGASFFAYTTVSA